MWPYTHAHLCCLIQNCLHPTESQSTLTPPHIHSALIATSPPTPVCVCVCVCVCECVYVRAFGVVPLPQKNAMHRTKNNPVFNFYHPRQGSGLGQDQGQLGLGLGLSCRQTKH